MPKSSSNPKVMSFGEHLDELRHRLLVAVFGLVPLLIAAMYYGKRVMEFLMEPVTQALRDNKQPAELIVTGVLEGFNSWFYLSVILTILAGAPWLLYQLWKFVAPGLYSTERRFVYIVTPLSVVLAVTSAMFTYFVMLPVILEFFVEWNASLPARDVAAAPLPEGAPALPMFPVLDADPAAPTAGSAWINAELSELRVCFAGPTADAAPVVRGVSLFGSSIVRQQYRLSQYIDLLLNFALAFAAGFQMPVVVLLLGWVGIVTPAMLRKYRRHAMMVCAVAGAALTPGDPLSMVLLTIPLYFLFELGLFLLRVLPASRVAGSRDESDRATA